MAQKKKTGPTTIRKILVANRGEIACRVMRTAHDLGIRTVAVYSEADAAAPHVTMADEAVLIGPGPVGQSYLVAEKILTAAKQTGADAIHPGYGFLSENADFSAAVEKAGLTFIGPTAESIDLMGNKAAAKRQMIEADVPCVPGYEGEDQSDKVLVAEGKKIGFPIMVKAAAGGGGRGMRLVEAADGLEAAISTARSEAENAFGSGELILEKAIVKPRHVEIQVFADSHGNVVHLGERDCSVQRRHQKVIEEAPCPVMTPDLRAAMGKAAVDAAKSIHYRGAGTVEFLLDADGSFYFLEMNTRLQVEHPVTEEVTDLDLVALQIKVAEGDRLGMTQEDVTLSGHAIEVRLYAEDPTNGFLPSTGIVACFNQLARAGVRYDTGIRGGQEISPFYDPMIAKLITTGPTREAARKLMVEALTDTALFGPKTNRDFLIACLEKQDFISGDFSTAFIAENFTDEELAAPVADATSLAILALRHFVCDHAKARAKAMHVPQGLVNFSAEETLRTPYKLAIGEAETMLSVRSKNPTHYAVHIGEDIIELTIEAHDGTHMVLNSADKQFVSQAFLSGETLYATIDGKSFTCSNMLMRNATADETGDGSRVTAPMHGKVIDVFVSKGDAIATGDRLAIIEAMKMQHEILAGVDGTVEDVLVAADAQVAADDLMIAIDTGEA
ncbi:acetyl-CoA carboxylase biotin carboxylase subunit [Alphaproteobacteria bacterium]|nr:acetyl-CoA carboxylase biotin carboxylase subunit [Alphaproteobacteria bacterium]